MQNAPKDLSDSSDKLANLEQQLREREEDRLLALAIGLQLRIQESQRPQQQQQQQQHRQDSGGRELELWSNSGMNDKTGCAEAAEVAVAAEDPPNKQYIIITIN
ncbi:hypothetical protein VTP01DRAFT_8863 [Rhizomucor pusillus]|uniref:uncharacterized protein n=1 Tax=Rhizomucor pusillus TaxID=4840 RepID=UPI0037432AD9